MSEWIEFGKFNEDSWPVFGLRLLIELKEKNPVTKQGWRFYAVFNPKEGFYLPAYNRTINANLVAAWVYAPVASAEKFTRKGYKK